MDRPVGGWADRWADGRTNGRLGRLAGVRAGCKKEGRQAGKMEDDGSEAITPLPAGSNNHTICIGSVLATFLC